MSHQYGQHWYFFDDRSPKHFSHISHLYGFNFKCTLITCLLLFPKWLNFSPHISQTQELFWPSFCFLQLTKWLSCDDIIRVIYLAFRFIIFIKSWTFVTYIWFRLRFPISIHSFPIYIYLLFICCIKIRIFSITYLLKVLAIFHPYYTTTLGPSFQVNSYFLRLPDYMQKDRLPQSYGRLIINEVNEPRIQSV